MFANTSLTCGSRYQMTTATGMSGCNVLNSSNDTLLKAFMMS